MARQWDRGHLLKLIESGIDLGLGTKANSSFNISMVSPQTKQNRFFLVPVLNEAITINTQW